MRKCGDQVSPAPHPTTAPYYMGQVVGWGGETRSGGRGDLRMRGCCPRTPADGGFTPMGSRVKHRLNSPRSSRFAASNATPANSRRGIAVVDRPFPFCVGGTGFAEVG